MVDDDVCADVDASDVCAFDVDAFAAPLFCEQSPDFRFDLTDEVLALDKKLAVTRLNGVSKSLSFIRPSSILSSISSKSSSSKLELEEKQK